MRGSVDQLDIGERNIKDTEDKKYSKLFSTSMGTSNIQNGDLKLSKWGPQTIKMGTSNFQNGDPMLLKQTGSMRFSKEVATLKTTLYSGYSGYNSYREDFPQILQ